MKSGIQRIVRKQAGFALLEILIFAAILPPAMLVASRASDIISKSSQFFKSSSTKNNLNVIKSFLVTQAGNPEEDGVFGLPKDASNGSGGALPGSLPLVTTDEWGTTYHYCNWDTGTANNGNASLSQNTVGIPGGGVIGQVISAGKDKTFQTACGTTIAAGDDVLVNIYNSDVLNSQGGIGGWKDSGSSVALLNPADNVGLGVAAPSHKLEFAAGTTPSAGIAMGEVEIYRKAANLLALSAGNSFNLDSGAIQIGGNTIIDSNQNMIANNLTVGGGVINMANGTSNMVVMSANGIAPPSTGATSIGSKLVLYPMGGGGLADYATGIESNAMWQSIPTNAALTSFKWYGGATNIMTLDGTGHLGVGTAANASYSINSAGAVNASAYYINGVPITSTTAGTVVGQTLYWDGSNWVGNSGVSYNSATGALNIAAGPLQMGGVTIIDQNRYLTGITWVGQNLNPAATNTYDLGNGIADQWKNIYGQNIYQNGNKVVDVFGGVTNYIPKFSGFNTLGNSLIYDDGINIGIGSTTPTVKLKVAGDIESNNLIRATGWLTGTATGHGTEIGVTGGYSYLMAYNRTASTYMPLRVTGSTVDIRAANNTSAIYIPETGNVLMGSATDTGSKAQVTGSTLASFTGTGKGVASLTTPYNGSSYTGIDFNYSVNGGAQARIAAQLTGSGSYLYFGTSNNYSSGITNTAMSIDPLANISMSNNLTVGGKVTASSYAGSVTGSSYGSITITGRTNGYSGIYLSDAAGTVTDMYDSAGNGGNFDPVTGWHFYWNRANQSLGIGGSATSAGYKAQVNGNLYTTGGILVGGTITRNVAGTGYLNGNYPNSENSSSSHAIYSIGGAYYPTATSLNTMYGIGYGVSGTSGITGTGVPNGNWGMYVAGGGVSRIFLAAETGNIYANGAINAGTTVNAVSYITSPDFYASSWFRNTSSLTGLFNSANNNHLYSESPYYWSLTTAGNTSGGFILRSTHQGAIKGYLYFNESGYGLLHSNGGWAVRVTPTTTDLYGTTITANGNFISTGTVTGTAVYNAVYN